MNIVSITGGKGGIGKTTLSINLAAAIAKTRKKVMLFDADLGLANVDVMLGIKPVKTIYDVLQGYCTIQDVCMTGPHGIKIIPSSSGIEKMADLTTEESSIIINSFSQLTDAIDIMITDMASGISKQNINFTHAAQDIIVVICNEPASIMDSYAVIKILHQRYSRSRFGIIVNKGSTLEDSYRVFTQFQQVTSQFMNISMQYLGYVPYDDYVLMAARENALVIDRYPYCEASRSMMTLSHGIVSWLSENTVSGGIHYFFEKLVNQAARTEDKLCEV